MRPHHERVIQRLTELFKDDPRYSRLPELELLLKQIPIYQEAERSAKIVSVFSQVLLLNWFIAEAEKREDRYLLMHAASELVLFGGRLILAHNWVLHPYHKWFMYEVRQAADKPANFVGLIDKLLAEPSTANSQTFVESIKTFQGWGVPYDKAVVHFAKDREWPWRTGPSPVQDW